MSDLIVTLHGKDDEALASYDAPSPPRVGDRVDFHSYAELQFEDVWRDDIHVRIRAKVRRVDWAIQDRHLNVAKTLIFVNVYLIDIDLTCEQHDDEGST